MDETVVEIEKLDLRPDRELLSPPWLAGPYQCATAVIVWGFVRTRVDVEVDGTIVVSVPPSASRSPRGDAPLPRRSWPASRLRVRSAAGADQPLVGRVEVRDHTVDYPTGPPRPQINPRPSRPCGSRTGVGNLLAAANVWITADGAEVGRVNGCAPQQGVNVNPFYSLGQKVRAHTSCAATRRRRRSSTSSQPGPNSAARSRVRPDVSTGGEQLRVTSIANGARVTISRGGPRSAPSAAGAGALLLGALAPVQHGRDVQRDPGALPGRPAEPSGTTEVCSRARRCLPRASGPCRRATPVTVTSSRPGRHRSGSTATSSRWARARAPVVVLCADARRGRHGPRHAVAARLPGQRALQLTVACVDPPISRRPLRARPLPRRLRRVRRRAGQGQRLLPGGRRRQGPAVQRAAGRDWDACRSSFMAHGNHSPGRPQLPGLRLLPARAWPRWGSSRSPWTATRSTALGGGVENIEDRADLIIDSIKHFQSLDADSGSIFIGRSTSAGRPDGPLARRRRGRDDPHGDRR